jgi:tetratricopeptide (TPR) repeat protein
MRKSIIFAVNIPQRTAIQVFVLLFLITGVCSCQNSKNKQQKVSEAIDKISKGSGEPSLLLHIQAYVAWGKNFLKRKSEGKGLNEERILVDAKHAFFFAVEDYIAYLYAARRGNLENAKSKCPLLQWIRDAYSVYGGADDKRDSELFKAFVTFINRKEKAFWNSPDCYFDALRDEFLKEFKNEFSRQDFFMSAHAGYPNTLYEIVDAYIALGVDYLALGQRAEAKKAFLRAICQRLYYDTQPIVYLRSPYWLSDIEEAYKLYGQGKEDKDFREIEEYIGIIYKGVF